MIFDTSSLLTAQESTIARTPTQLAHWVEEKCRLFASYKEAKERVLLHKGLFKRFYEEVYPLSLFATHLYGGRSDIRCVSNMDNRDFDALIIDYSTLPPSELKVEITSAIQGYDQHLRMKCFVERGHVNVWGKLSASGTEKKGHYIHVENEAIDRADLLKDTLWLIRLAIKRKCSRRREAQKYGQGHVLIVTFDDWQWFEPEQDIPTLRTFIEEHVLMLPLHFAALYVLGLSGKTLVFFRLTKIQDLTT